MADSDPLKCVLCSDNASPRVCKDESYVNMLGLLWTTLNIDVKFTENEKFELCAACFGKTADFYDLNDSCVIMEKHMDSLTNDLVTQNLAGIKKMKDAGKQCFDPHLKFEQVYPDLQPPQVNGGKKGYLYDISKKLEDIEQSEKYDEDLDSTKSTTISFTKVMDSSQGKNFRKTQHPTTTTDNKRPRRRRHDSSSDDSD